MDSESDVFAVWSERGGGALDRSPNIDGRVNYNQGCFDRHCHGRRGHTWSLRRETWKCSELKKLSTKKFKASLIANHMNVTTRNMKSFFRTSFCRVVEGLRVQYRESGEGHGS